MIRAWRLKMDKCLAIIAARGGSKRIPRKNIKDFLGRPVLEYSVDAALKSGCFDDVIVSTDDKDIRDAALSCGAKVPFLRSKRASGDHATTADAIIEVLGEYKKTGRQFEYCCCIYPTAPFVTIERLKKGFDVLKETGADSVIPIVRFGYPIQRALKIEDGRIHMMWPENLNIRSQDLTPAYHDAGQFYWMKVESFLRNKSIIAENTSFIELPESEAHDIDNEEDWIMAELKYKILKGSPGAIKDKRIT